MNSTGGIAAGYQGNSLTRTNQNQFDENHENFNSGGGLYSQNHQCIWRKTYDQEAAKRQEVENTLQAHFNLLEKERGHRMEIEKQNKELREQIKVLQLQLHKISMPLQKPGQSSTRNIGRNHLVRCQSQRSNDNNIIGNGIQSQPRDDSLNRRYAKPKLQTEEQMSKAPAKKNISVFASSRNRRGSSRQKLHPIATATQSSVDFLTTDQRCDQQFQAKTHTQGFFQPLTNLIEEPEAPPRGSSIERIHDQEKQESVKRKSDLASIRVSQCLAPLIPSHERKRVGGFNMPLTRTSQTRESTYIRSERNSSMNLQQHDDSSMVLMMTRDSFGQTRNSNLSNVHQTKQKINSSQEQTIQIEAMETQKKATMQRPSKLQQQHNEIVTILQNQPVPILGFSKLRIFAYDGQGHANKMHLDNDLILKAQAEYFKSINREKRSSTKSMHQMINNDDNSNLKTFQKHTRTDTQDGQQNLLSDHILPVYTYHDGRSSNEEDVIDGQEEQKAALFTQQLYGQGVVQMRREEHRFDNSAQEAKQMPNPVTTTYDVQDLVTPINKKDNNQKCRYNQIYADNTSSGQEATQRVLNYDLASKSILDPWKPAIPNSFEDPELQQVLETPIGRIQPANRIDQKGGITNWDEDKDFSTFRQKQKNEYSDEQIRIMQMSIRNISTNKKSSRVRQQNQAARLGKKKERIPHLDIGQKLKTKGLSAKIDQKDDLESFRPPPTFRENDQFNNPSNNKVSIILEEQTISPNADGSDEELNYMTESQETFRHKHNRSEALNIQKDNRLSRNPNYSRITHASKQQLHQQGHTQAPSRLGNTMLGFHQDTLLSKASPLLQSMPTFDIKHFKQQKSVDQTSNYFGNIPSGAFQTIQQESDYHQHHHNTSNNFFRNNLTADSGQGFHSPQLSIAANQNLSQNKQVKFKVATSSKTTKAAKIFDEFFIIGVDKNEIQQQTWQQSNRQFMAPQTLYMYNQEYQQEEHCERRNVVKNFCFPDGIEVNLVKPKGIKPAQFKTSHRVQKILYSAKSLKEQCFIFTLNANADEREDATISDEEEGEVLETFPGCSNFDRYYSCLCVVFNELITDEASTNFSELHNEAQIEKQFTQARIYSSKKAYCFMFSNQYYQLHLDVIITLIEALKYERINNSNKFFEMALENMITFDQTIGDIIAWMDLPLIHGGMVSILNKYSQLQLNEKTLLPLEGRKDQLSLILGNEQGTLHYEIPTRQDLLFLDSMWFCPTLFSLFEFDSLCNLLSAILLERSVVFVGKQNRLSSAILGFNSLLYPFKWCLALVPILPHPLIEMLEAPLPLLVGITKREYKDITLNKYEKASKIWVFLDSGDIIWNEDGLINPVLDFKSENGAQLELEYNNYRKDYHYLKDQHAVTSRDALGASQQLADTLRSANSAAQQDLNQSVIQNEDMRSNCRNICEHIRQQIKKHILDMFKKKKTNITQENLVQNLGELAVEGCRKQDREFVREFIKTQMFTTYIEENAQLLLQFQS